jgi:hypothetical protein
LLVAHVERVTVVADELGAPLPAAAGVAALDEQFVAACGFPELGAKAFGVRGGSRKAGGEV